MSDSDSPSGRGDRTIIRPNPGARRPAAPMPASAAPAAPGAPAAAPPPAGRRGIGGGVDQDRSGTAGRPGAAARRRPQGRRPGRAQREPDHARGGSAAAAARAAARRAAARAVRQPDGAGRRRGKILREGHPLRRHPGGAGQPRQIHPLRHRRRHRPEHPDRGPPRLDAIQHAQPLLRRAHRRRAVLRRARARQDGSARQLLGARAAARLPRARLPGHPPDLSRRPVRPAADPAESVRDPAARATQGHARSVAALAGTGAREQPVQGAGAAVGGRRRVGVAVVRAVPGAALSARRRYRRQRARHVDPASRYAADARAAGDRAAASAAPAAGRSRDAAAAHPAQARPGDFRRQGLGRAERHAHLRAGRRRGDVPGRAGDRARRVQAGRAAHCADVGARARRHQGRRPHRLDADQHCAVPVELSSLGGSGEGGRGAAQAAAGEARPHRDRRQGRRPHRSRRTQTPQGRTRNRRVEFIIPRED